MTSLATILRDLARTAIRAAGRAMQSSRTAGSSIEMPDLATVEEARRDRDVPGDDHADPEQDHRRRASDDEIASPGQFGASATIEVDPRDLDLVRTSYNPDADGDPDPGEVVWTWVPYEEADGRGKDRPVVVVARLADDAVLAVHLSSRDHDDDPAWVGIGAGDWDGQHRPSWVNVERILLIRPDGMRREAAVLDRDRFSRVEHALTTRHRWPT